MGVGKELQWHAVGEVLVPDIVVQVTAPRAVFGLDDPGLLPVRVLGMKRDRVNLNENVIKIQIERTVDRQ